MNQITIYNYLLSIESKFQDGILVILEKISIEFVKFKSLTMNCQFLSA